MRLSGLYGADRWTRAYGETVNAAWADALSSRTTEDITRGVAVASRDDTGYLPTAGTFAAWCRPYAVDAYLGASGAETELPSLPRLAAGSAVGRRWLAFMYAEGHLPRPEGVNDETLDRALSGANVAAMRERVERGRREIAGRYRDA